MAAIEVSCGAVHQTVGSDELVGFLLLMGGQDIDPGLSELASLLAHQYRDTRHFPAFYGGLVVPRDAPFQFLRTGTPAWLDRVASIR